jgi:hypothetical protein
MLVSHLCAEIRRADPWCSQECDEQEECAAMAKPQPAPGSIFGRVSAISYSLAGGRS